MITDRAFSAAQQRFDHSGPDDVDEYDERLQEWFAACPTPLSSFNEQKVRMILQDQRTWDRM
jgi:hypothetical protein